MDNNMTFKTHIDELHRKVTGTLLYLNRVNGRFDSHCRLIAVQSLVLSILNYGLRVWGVASKTQMHRVQKLQNFAGKVAVGGARRIDHATPILEKLEWLRIGLKYFYDICILMFKIRNNLVPEWLFSMPTVEDVRGELVITRQNDCLFIPRTRTDTGARALSVRGPSFWNQLPADIRNCHSITSFKTKLFRFLFKK